MNRKLKVVIVGDLHLPFCDYKKLFLAYKLIEKENPDIVIQCGDVLDLYSQSRFARSHDIMTPKEELEEGISAYKNFWAQIKKITKRSCRRIQLGGNHTDRVERLAVSKAPELLPFIDTNKIFKLPGLELHMDSRYELSIEGILYIHGWLSSSFAHARYFNKPVVHGHLHSASITFENMKDGMLWSMSCGYLADPLQVPLLYRATKTAKWAHGISVVDKLGPRFISI